MMKKDNDKWYKFFDIAISESELITINNEYSRIIDMYLNNRSESKEQQILQLLFKKQKEEINRLTNNLKTRNYKEKLIKDFLDNNRIYDVDDNCINEILLEMLK